jgi:hypothetical protein
MWFGLGHEPPQPQFEKSAGPNWFQVRARRILQEALILTCELVNELGETFRQWVYM